MGTTMQDATIISEWVASLDVVVIESIDNSCFYVAGQLPAWWETIYPSLAASSTRRRGVR